MASIKELKERKAKIEASLNDAKNKAPKASADLAQAIKKEHPEIAPIVDEVQKGKIITRSQVMSFLDKKHQGWDQEARDRDFNRIWDIFEPLAQAKAQEEKSTTPINETPEVKKYQDELKDIDTQIGKMTKDIKEEKPKPDVTKPAARIQTFDERAGELINKKGLSDHNKESLKQTIDYLSGKGDIKKNDDNDKAFNKNLETLAKSPAFNDAEKRELLDLPKLAKLDPRQYEEHQFKTRMDSLKDQLGDLYKKQNAAEDPAEYTKPIAEIRKTYDDLAAHRKESAGQLLEEELSKPEDTRDSSVIVDARQIEADADKYLRDAEVTRARANENEEFEKWKANKPQEKSIKDLQGEKTKAFPEGLPEGLTEAQALGVEGKPLYYSETLRNLIERAKHESQKPFQPYLDERIAPESAEEKAASDILKKLIGPESYKHGRDKLRDLAGLKTDTEEANLNAGLTEAKTKTTPDNLKEYTNPYNTSILELIKRRKQENYDENIKPKIKNQFIGSGAYLTGKRLEKQRNAERDFQRELADIETKFMFQANDKAAETASSDKTRYLNFLLEKANVGNERLQQESNIAQQVSGLEKTLHDNQALDLTQLRDIGEKERSREQAEKELKYKDYLRQQDYEATNLDRLNRLMNQHNLDTFTASNTVLPPEPDNRVSPAQRLAGIATQVMAMRGSEKQPFAKGGIVQHKAGGGLIDQVRDEYIQNLLQQGQQAPRQKNPWLDYLGSIGSTLASSNNPDPLAALGEGSSMGYGAFRETQAANENARLTGIQQGQAGRKSILNLLQDETKQQREAERFNLEKSDQALNQRYKEAQIEEILSKTNKNKASISPTGKRKITAGQQSQYSKILEELDVKANAAKELLTVADNLEKEYDKYNAEASWLNKPGGKLSRYASGLQPLLASETEQNIADTIDADNSVMLRAVRKTMHGEGGIGEGENKDIKTGLPTRNKSPAAVKSILKKQKLLASETLAKQAFIDAWAEANGGDILGAEGAFTGFWHNNEGHLIDGNNHFIEESIPEIQEYVLGLLNKTLDEIPATVNPEASDVMNQPIDKNKAIELLKMRAGRGDAKAKQALKAMGG
jgi:hypothetical protein